MKDLQESVGLRGDWTRLRATWNANAGEYAYEMDEGGAWVPYREDHPYNVFSTRYRGGPKDGELEM